MPNTFMKEHALKLTLETIGKNLRKLRQAHDEKVEATAINVKVHHSVISKIEHGSYEGLSIKLIIRFATHYKIPVETFLKGCS